MSMLDKFKALLVKHESKVGKAVDAAARTADKRTKGKYSRQLRTGSTKAKQAAARMADEHRRTHGGPASPGGPPSQGGPGGGPQGYRGPEGPGGQDGQRPPGGQGY
ncbi:antitoxin [Streptomyces sp. JJ66]|uniref:antitoxin n=1 Tax=Streptomyces sp. JJ66 TaxID=2803843 RepID=UPI001C5A0945|nr:antitoxin [Streptomyces sp. JJ66]MBW1600850.1 antitoxin [Streptomyces sp. JJ66]